MKKITALTWLLACATLATGQSKDVYEYYKGKFPDEAAVYVERSETMTILPEADSLRIYTDVTEDLLLLKGEADIFSGKRVYGSHFSQVNNLKAKTLVWDKNRYKEMNVSDFKKNSDRDAGIFYDDSYYYSFNFPSVSSRNRTLLEYRENLKDSRFMGGFIFASYMPQGKTSFTIKTTKDVELFTEVKNDPDKKIQFKKTEKGNNVTYEWSAQDLAKSRAEDESPSLRYYAPHVVCYVKSYQAKNGRVNVLRNLDDLYKWYSTFVAGLDQQQPSPELTDVVSKLKAISRTDLELVRNVFYWVQGNIQYIAFEQGMRGLIPHPGSYVCEKRYGDCKDMANLIVSMLQIANVKSYRTWIGTRDLPYKYTELPTPLVDNHMIATYIAADGQYYFLDATGDHTAFGLPSSMIQGKEALIGIDADHYEVKTVPILPKEKNRVTDSVSLRIDANQLVGDGASTLTGYPKIFAGYELDRAENDDIKRSVTRLIAKGSNKFFLDNYKVQFLENRDTPTRITYAFRIADYFQKIGDEIYINLNLTKTHYNDFINPETRKTPKENDYRRENDEVIEFTIPDGYTVEYLPANVKYDGKVMGYDISYAVTGNKVRFTRKFYIDYVMLWPDQFKNWNDAVKSVSEAYKESLILKKK